MGVFGVEAMLFVVDVEVEVATASMVRTLCSFTGCTLGTRGSDVHPILKGAIYYDTYFLGTYNIIFGHALQPPMFGY